MDKVSIGKRIRKIRNELGLTMSEFGIKVDSVKSGVVSNWENGKQTPNKKRLKLIADIGNISVEELLYGSFEERVFEVTDEIYQKFLNDNESALIENKELYKFFHRTLNSKISNAIRLGEEHFNFEIYESRLLKSLETDIDLGIRDLNSLTLFAYYRTSQAQEEIIVTYYEDDKGKEMLNQKEIKEFVDEMHNKYQETMNFIDEYRTKNGLISIKELDE